MQIMSTLHIYIHALHYYYCIIIAGARIASEAGSREGIHVIGACRRPPENPGTYPFVDAWRRCDLTVPHKHALDNDKRGCVRCVACVRVRAVVVFCRRLKLMSASTVDERVLRLMSAFYG
jgi:hypothetical protein